MLGLIAARMDPRAQRRVEGFSRTASTAGAYDDRRVVTSPAPSSVALGCQLFAELIERAPTVDAVFCNNDDLALGVMFEARRCRL